MIRRRHLILVAVPLLLAAIPSPDSSDPAVPDGRSGDWFTDADYPLDAARAGQEGVVAFQLTIDRAGTPTHCTVTISSGVPSLDAVTCAKLLERARFKPGRNAAGETVTCLYNGRITWRLPNPDTDGMLPPLPTMTVITFFIEPDGMATNCQIMVNGKPAADLGQCASQILGRHYPIQRDAAGKPMRQKIRMTMGVEKVDEDK